MGISKNFQKKEKVFIIKVCNLESEGYFLFHHIFYFSLFANHKRIIPLGSQKEEMGNVSKLSKQDKYKQAGQNKCSQMPKQQPKQIFQTEYSKIVQTSFQNCPNCPNRKKKYGNTKCKRGNNKQHKQAAKKVYQYGKPSQQARGLFNKPFSSFPIYLQTFQKKQFAFFIIERGKRKEIT